MGRPRRMQVRPEHFAARRRLRRRFGRGLGLSLQPHAGERQQALRDPVLRAHRLSRRWRPGVLSSVVSAADSPSGLSLSYLGTYLTRGRRTALPSFTPTSKSMGLPCFSRSLALDARRLSARASYVSAAVDSFWRRLAST